MTEIGSIGRKDEADNPAYRGEWQPYSNGKPAGVLAVDCTFNPRTNWKLTILSLRPEVAETVTITGNFFMLIVTTRKPPKRKI